MVYYIYDAYFGPFAVRGRQQDKEIQLVRLSLSVFFFKKTRLKARYVLR